MLCGPVAASITPHLNTPGEPDGTGSIEAPTPMPELKDVLARLRAIAGNLPHDERPIFSPAPPAEAITSLQACVHLPIQDDFISFLKECDAIIAMSIWNGYWVGGVSTLARSIRRKDYPSQLSRKWGQPDVMPVATDGGGNAFLMCLKDGSIWKWDHETGDCTTVARDFISFLIRIAEDWEHYLAGDRSWNYLAG